MIRKFGFETMNMINFLEERSLLHELKYVKPYYVDWFIEFYANLRPKAGKSISSNMEKSFFGTTQLLSILILLICS